jgi:hypothetical protein
VTAGAVTTGPELETSPALAGSGVEGGYSPENLRKAYNLPSKTAGAGQTVAVVDAYDDPNAEADLNIYRSHYGIPECTTANGCFRKVNQSGGAAPPSANSSWAEETSLDLDMVSAVCPNCHILLVEANTESSRNLAVAVEEAVKLGATEISNSYGSPERAEPAEIAAYDHPGIPITVAAGDDGYGVDVPANNPHVIAVGGTTLSPESNTRGWKETVWYGVEEGEVFGTGSGCSKEPKPPWQNDKGCAFRTNNDIAVVGDQNTPVSAYDSYNKKKTESPWMLEGGTSVGAPIVAAAMALTNIYTRSLDGAQALNHDSAINGSTAFNDVVSGKNGNCGNYLCQAKEGYDGPTGLGTLNGAPELPPPVLATKAASSLGSSDATLNATIVPNGATITQCRFEYGLTTSYGYTVACAESPGSGLAPVLVSAQAAGLQSSTLYHFRINATYQGGSGVGGEEVFATAGSPPSVNETGLSNLTGNGATPTAGTPKLVSTILAVSRRGSLVVLVSCPVGASTCTGNITLHALTAARSASRNRHTVKHTVLLATGPFTVAGGRVATLRLKLSSRAKALLKRARVLHARATLTPSSGGGAALRLAVTIRAARH